ncbi:hypothetical protein ACLBX9_23450 [Methylobacterium sp. A49B]
MRRLATALTAIGLATTGANAACHKVPVIETSKVLIGAFSQRMKQVGADDWHFGTQTTRGPMFFSLDSRVQLFVKDADGLAGEVGLLLNKPTPTDNVQFEAAATFLAAYISGVPESALRPLIVRAIAEVRRTRENQTVRDGETTLILSSPDVDTVAVISGRLRCDRDRTHYATSAAS